MIDRPQINQRIPAPDIIQIDLITDAFLFHHETYFSMQAFEKSLAEAIEWLSPGERMLFYMSIFFSLKRSGKGKCVIILEYVRS